MPPTTCSERLDGFAHDASGSSNDTLGTTVLVTDGGAESDVRPERVVGLPHELPGHHPDATQMMNGGVRAECTCGWWSDVVTLDQARLRLRTHFKELRKHRV